MTIRYAAMINEVGNPENRRWLKKHYGKCKLISHQPSFCDDDMWETSWDARAVAETFLDEPANHAWTFYGLFQFTHKPSSVQYDYSYSIEVGLLEEPLIDD